MNIEVRNVRFQHIDEAHGYTFMADLFIDEIQAGTAYKNNQGKTKKIFPLNEIGKQMIAKSKHHFDIEINQETNVSKDRTTIVYMDFPAYQKWCERITNNRVMLTSSINRLSQDQNKVYQKLYQNLERLSDLKYVCTKASTVEKQELIRLGFDNNLYYKNGIYRTPTMIDELAHNHLIMKEKGLLIYERERGNHLISPLSGLTGITIEHLIPFLTFLDGIK